MPHYDYSRRVSAPSHQTDLSNDAEFCYACDVWHHSNGHDYRVDTWGDVVHVDDYEEPEPDYDDDDYCGSDCINGYGYKPQPVFHGSGDVFFGVEVELESNGNRSLTRVAEEVQETLGTVGYLKEDGSLYDGFEMVTHPMSYRWAMRSFPWNVFNTLQEDMRDDHSTGIHVHVGRTAFSNPLHMYRWHKWFYRNKALVQHVARRGSVNYCSWEARSYDPRSGDYVSERNKAAVYAKQGNRDSDRYTVLNMQNSETVEVRCFQSTTSADELKAILGLMAASVEYTRNLTAREVCQERGWDSDAFVAYVNREPEYAPLASTLASF